MSSLKKNNILVTGGAGFIGSHLCENLLERGEEVFVVDDLSTGTVDNIKHLKDNSNLHFLYKKYKYETNEPYPLLELKPANFNNNFFAKNGQKGPRPISVVDTYPEQGNMHYFVEKIIEDKKIDEIYHLAASVGVKLIIEQPLKSFRNNIIGTDIVLKYAQIRNAKVLIASSSEVYGKNDGLPFKEDGDRVYGSVYNDRWGYALSKGTDEFLALAYFREKHLPVVIVRLFNVIGSRQTGFYGMVVPTFIKQAREGREITVFGNGEQTRCFAYVEDVVNALIGLMDNAEDQGQIFNLGSEEEISIKDLAQKVKTLTQSSSPIIFIPYTQAYGKGFEDMAHRRPDISRIKNLINWQPKFTLEESLKKIIGYFPSR